VSIPPKALSTNLRRGAGTLFRKHRWLLPAAAIANGVAVGAAIVLHVDYRLTFLAAVCLSATSFGWGYLERFLKLFPWPTFRDFARGQYAETWNAMAESPKTARVAVCGASDEREVRASAAEPVRNLIELVSVTDRDDVLEIACGIARVGLELAPRCRSWMGADISANMLHYARQRLQGVGNVHLHQLQSEGLRGLGDGAFDVVYCTNSMAHMDELYRWRYVRDAFRILRPGGRILFDNVDMTSDRGWIAFTNLEDKYRNAEIPPYMVRFSFPEELMEYAARAGFGQVKIHKRGMLVIMTAVKPHGAQDGIT